jgi:hypothetical protein
MVDEGLHDGVTEISFPAMFRERMKNMPAEVREKRFRNVGDPRRTDRFKSTYEYGVKSLSLHTALRPTSELSRHWNQLSPNTGARGFLVLIRRLPT